MKTEVVSPIQRNAFDLGHYFRRNRKGAPARPGYPAPDSRRWKGDRWERAPTKFKELRHRSDVESSPVPQPRTQGGRTG